MIDLLRPWSKFFLLSKNQKTIDLVNYIDTLLYSIDIYALQPKYFIEL